MAEDNYFFQIIANLKFSISLSIGIKIKTKYFLVANWLGGIVNVSYCLQKFKAFKYRNKSGHSCILFRLFFFY